MMQPDLVDLEVEYNRQWSHNSWGAVKHPDDLARYTVAIEASKPEVIVEIGTAHGGGTRFFRSFGVDVITVDTHDSPVELDGAIKVTGDSLAVFDEVRHLVGDRCAMVSLDGCHYADHVQQEIALYSALVGPGQYLVVEDGVVSYYNPGNEDGSPRDAVAATLARWDGWTYDEALEDLTPYTTNPDGWWRRA